MALLLLLVQLIAIALSKPFEINDMGAFKNPEATSNVIYWVAIILVFTAFILAVIKLNKKWIIQAFIYFTVASTLYYVFYAIFSGFLAPGLNFLLTLILSIALTVILYKFPEWYVIDIIGVIIGAGAASIFGISLAIIPTLLLLVLLLVYDYIAVYRTKHMVTLAEGVMDLRLPILLVIPKHWDYSFLTEKFDKEEREAFFMGLGDAVMPTILVISAITFGGLLFSWSDVPGHDDVKLTEYLNQKFGIDWVNNAKIEKIDDNRTLRVYSDKNNLFLTLNDDKTRLNLSIDDGRTYELIVKVQGGNLNIYREVSSYTLPFIGTVIIPAIGAIVGTFVGFAVLLGFVMKGKPQAGLPFLNGGVILGYVVGSLIAGSPII